ncbi:MAG: DUF3560 domain-containing protein [Pseudomonadota bacterium]
MAVGEPYKHDWAFITQPGHIPARERVIRAEEKAWEHEKMAQHHESKAAGTERMLANTIFSDDANAIEALREKIAKERAMVERMKAANKIVRKHKEPTPDAVAALVAQGFTAEQAAKLFEPDFAGRLGFPGYALTNTGANIRRMEGRIVEIERRNNRQAEAEAAPGGVVIKGEQFVNVTFAEKPDREILTALKAAGFRWGGGMWAGYREKIPAAVLALVG